MTNEQLVALIRAGDNEAENMLVLWQQNKGFIYKIAMKYQGYAEIEDLLQEGYLGLCEAVQHYDAEQGASFIHYAAFWIHQVMQRYVYSCCNNIRVPEHTKNYVLQYQKISNEYYKWYGKQLTDKEIRAFLGVSRERLAEIKQAASTTRIRSFSEVIGGEDEEFTLGDTVASEENIEDNIAEKFDTGVMEKELWTAVDNLPENYSKVLRHRYQDKMTLKEIGQNLGVTMERVRQIERSALRKLRVPSRNESFREYYEQYIAPASIHHVGLETFKRTWISAVEAEVLRGYDFG